MTAASERTRRRHQVRLASQFREVWLTEMVERLRPVFEERAGLTIPASVKVSCGFPHKGGTGARSRVIGQCHFEAASKVDAIELFLHPELDAEYGAKPGETRRYVRLLGVLVHELIHACLDPNVGHKGRFVTSMKALGLTGKPTATTEGPDFGDLIEPLLEGLPPYPHGALRVNPPKQTTRMIKVGCIDCDTVARMSRTQIMRGLPDCPHCHVPWDVYPNEPFIWDGYDTLEV